MNRYATGALRSHQAPAAQARNDRPGDLDLIAAVHLRGFRVIVIRLLSGLHDRINQETRDRDEDACGNRHDEIRQVYDRIRRRLRGSKDTGRVHRFARIVEREPDALPVPESSSIQRARPAQPFTLQSKVHAPELRASNAKPSGK
jgi:hypothetical protein